VFVEIGHVAGILVGQEIAPDIAVEHVFCRQPAIEHRHLGFPGEGLAAGKGKRYGEWHAAGHRTGGAQVRHRPDHAGQRELGEAFQAGGIALDCDKEQAARLEFELPIDHETAVVGVIGKPGADIGGMPFRRQV